MLGALGLVLVTFIIVAAALSEAGHRFRTSHQSSRWAQAGHAAEAGAEIALLALQRDSWVADGWSGIPGAPGATAVTKTISLATGVPATGPINVNVAVDKVTMGSSHWLRIRSTGAADLAGGALAAMDPQDTMLRKLTLRQDRITGTSVAAPRAARTYEILAGPKADRPFKHSFVSKQLFDLKALTTSDSYDSSDSAKSDFSSFGTYGVFTQAKRQNNGSVGTTDSLNQWNFNNAYIYGDAYSPTGNVANAGNIQGSVRDDFTYTFPDEVSPGWSTVTQNHGAVTNVNKTIVAGTEASPPRHKMSSVELTGAGKNIKIQNPAGQSESWVELWITGDTKISGASGTGIKIDPGVHCTIHFGGKLDVSGGSGGYAIENGSKLPSRLILRAYGGSSGNNTDFIFQNFDFWGVISAPWYKLKFDLPGKQASGSFLAWQFDVSDNVKLHYDEALGALELGQSTTYAVKSWVEAVR